VTFEQGTPLSSSPVSSLQPEPPSDLLPAGSKHMVMSTSFPLFDITSSPTAFYRPVVDKLLRYVVSSVAVVVLLVLLVVVVAAAVVVVTSAIQVSTCNMYCSLISKLI